MTFHRNEYGGRYPDNPYFPMYLSNGVDAMLVNITGSGNPWYEAFAGSYMQCVGWYKCDRRTYRDNNLVYGVMLPLLDFHSQVIVNGDPMVPRDCEQFFDPIKATLTTLYEQNDPESTALVRVRVTSFLSADHTLVERYDVLSAPLDGLRIRFVIQSPSYHHVNLTRNIAYPDIRDVTFQSEKRFLQYKYLYRNENLHGRAVSWTDRAISDVNIYHESETGEWRCVRGETVTEAVYTGGTVTRYITVMDNVDDEEYESSIEARVLNIRSRGYVAVRADHEKEWRTYFEASSVELEDESLQYLYDVSRYVIRANNHPEIGFQPVGNLPYLFGGAMFWDASFAVLSYLGAGNRDEALRTAGFIRDRLPEARKLAASYGYRGARIEWTTGTREFSRYPGEVLEFHNNSVWAHILYQCYEYLHDTAFLESSIEMIEELLIFMVDRCLIESNGRFIIARCEGIDESVENQKLNDTWTGAITLKALMEYQSACNVLNRESRIRGLNEIISGLSRGLGENVDDDGVLQSYRGGRIPHFGSLVFHVFPDHPALKTTVMKMMENHDVTRDLYNFLGSPRYSLKAFPWGNYWMIRILSLVGDTLAYRLLENVARCTGYFGSTPERIWYHNEHVNEWFSTASAAAVWAFHGMLANLVNGRLRILGGVHEHWRRVSFSGIHVGKGLVVSARVAEGNLLALDIDNLSGSDQILTVDLGTTTLLFDYVLKPGLNLVNCSRFSETGPTE